MIQRLSRRGGAGDDEAEIQPLTQQEAEDGPNAGLLIAVAAASLVLVMLYGRVTTSYDSYRLPRGVVPETYSLSVDVDLSTFNFSGTVDIKVNVLESTDRIVLNAVDLDVSSVELLPANAATAERERHLMPESGDPDSGENTDDAITPDVTHVEKKYEMLVFYFPGNISVGAHVLRISYAGKLDEGMHGLYRSKYQRGNETHWIALTDFEPSSARRAFPCFDEPAFKANFTIAIRTSPGNTVLSNMPLHTEKEVTIHGKKLKEFRFLPSYRMSTYLVCFVVCDFDHVEARTTEGTIVRAWAPSHLIKSAEYPLNIARDVLPFYSSLYGFPYPLPKLDLIAIPDFNAGAMENWGLVTFREEEMLIDVAMGSESDKQRVMIVVCHELAHQWFGNLVTMAWWDELWLNEGFATFVSYVAAAHLQPTWKMDDQFIVEIVQPALAADSQQSSSHPIVNPLESAAAASQMFDALSYKKASSVLHMVRAHVDAVGYTKGRHDSAFNAALRLYLNRHMYGTATQSDLWLAMKDTVGVPMGSLTKEWTLAKGHPVLAIIAGPSSGPDGLNMSVSQVPDWRGVAAPTPLPESSAHTKKAASGTPSHPTPTPTPAPVLVDRWWVPFTFRSSDELTPHQYPIDRVATANLPVKWPATNPSSYVVANTGRTAFARTVYPESMLSRLEAHLPIVYGALPPPLCQAPLTVSVLSVADKATMLDDYFSLTWPHTSASADSQSGKPAPVQLPVGLALNMSRAFLPGEIESHAVWASAAGHLGGIMRALVHQPNRDCLGSYREWVSSTLVGPPFALLKWDAQPQDAHQVRRLRALLVSTAIQFDEPQVIGNAMERFDKFMEDPSAHPIDPEYREAVYAAAMDGDGASFDHVLAVYISTPSNQERIRCLRALASARSETQLQRLLSLAETTFRKPSDVSGPALRHAADGPMVLIYMAAHIYNPMNMTGHALAWHFVRTHWHDIMEHWSSQVFEMRSMLQAVIMMGPHTEAWVVEVEAFFADNTPPKDTQAAVNQGVTAVRGAILWVDANVAAVCDWVKHN